ncbi:MAG: hypothetical protein EBU88_00600 [Acidobacteria bacterium]|nr:hypothetical protein [Acidobacteriota bacterium]
MHLKIRQILASNILALLTVLTIASSNLMVTRGQVRANYDLGASGLGQKLKRLQTTASLMHTAAHPDDEDSGLLARLARGDNVRVSYLSLTRGEGGQNVIGPELFESLGIIRSEELLQARRLDGGEQFFTRFMEYGFSKKRSEAAQIWDERAVLSDMVRAIRLFRPLVIASRFSGTPADGHGQHQLAGYLTPIAFRAAADPQQFPEHFAEGLTPWQAKKLYVGMGFGANQQNPATLTVSTGDFDPLIGRSYFEIAAEGRSQHKSQEMGSLELRGRQQTGLRLLEAIDGKIANEKGIFDGLDTSIRGIAKLTGNTESLVEAQLAALQETAEAALRGYDPFNPQKIVPILARGVAQASEAIKSTANSETRFMIRQKEVEFTAALQAAAGIVIDALSNSETVVAGDSVGVAVRTFVPEKSGITIVDATLRTLPGWKVEAVAEPKPEPVQTFRPRTEVSTTGHFFNLLAPTSAKPTQPYWLEVPRQNFTFDWSQAGPDKNRPFQADIAVAEVKIKFGDQDLILTKPVVYRFADDIRGEIRRNLNVVPLVTNTLESNLIIAPTSTKLQRQRIVLSVTNNAPREIKGTVSLDLPTGWTVSPNTTEFSLKGRGEKTAVSFDVTIPGGLPASSYDIVARSVVDGRSYSQTMFEISYPHIQTHRRYGPSKVDVQVVDLKVSPVNVGYIMGTGDRVPDAIRLLGLPVTMLTEKDLSTGDLSKFDTIVVGIRASQVRRDFVANNGRILDYVRNGGSLIVQYQQQEYVRDNLLPFPARLDAVINGTQRLSNLRTVDENAPVKILVPDHPIFNFPNRIGESDFRNWVQERHLYSLSSLDPRYTPLLESHDEGEPEIAGGMIHARIGKGHFIYNAYSFFRQLPTGNPGAFRLFANLLSLSKAGK